MLKVSKTKNKGWVVYLTKIGGGRQYFREEQLAINFAKTRWIEYLQNKFVPITITGKNGVDKWYESQVSNYKKGFFLKQELTKKANASKKFLDMMIQGKSLRKWNLDELVVAPRSPASITDDIQNQILEMNLSYKSKYDLYFYVKNIFNFFYDRKWTHDNAIGSKKFPKKPHDTIDNKAIRITKENIQKIIHNAKPKYKTIIKFAAFTGLRQGELRELRWKDINFEKNIITVKRGYQLYDTIGLTKNKNGRRIVPLVPSVAQELKELSIASGRPNVDELVFVGKDGKRIYG